MCFQQGTGVLYWDYKIIVSFLLNYSEPVWSKDEDDEEKDEENAANQQMNQSNSQAPPVYQSAPITVNNNVGMAPQQQFGAYPQQQAASDQNQFTF